MTRTTKYFQLIKEENENLFEFVKDIRVIPPWRGQDNFREEDIKT